MPDHWYGGVPKAKVTGNRMKVYFDMLGKVDPWTEYKGKTVRFADKQEARDFAELHDFDDGIRVVCARGYGLKPRIDKLLKG
jgi:hypothetical protein